MTNPNFLYDMERRDSERERHKENAARLAFSFFSFDSTGSGSVEWADRVDFGATFVEKPYVAYGAELNLDHLAELLGLDSGVDDVPDLPISTGFVTEWDQDERGFYLGCWCAVSVSVAASELPVTSFALMEMAHHFTFSGIAIKDVPIDVRD